MEASYTVVAVLIFLLLFVGIILLIFNNEDRDTSIRQPPAKPAAPGSYDDLQRQLQEKRELIKLVPAGSDAFGQLEDEIWEILTQLHRLGHIFGHQMEEIKS